jgi:SAM-dependent methyltransferase
MAVHPAAAVGFDIAADAYERGRPSFPAEAVELVASLCPSGRPALEVAAGTGKLTRLLVARGVTPVAVEPVPGMRRVLAQTTPGVAQVAGVAEALPIRTGAVGAVVASQAFHWFANATAVAELHRVLEPGGHLVLVWNVRDETVPWVAELGRIHEPYRGDTPHYQSGAWRGALTGGPFGPLHERHFAVVQHMSPDDVVDRILSVSFIAALPDAGRAAVAEQLRDLLATHPDTRGRDVLELPYRTDVIWAEAPGARRPS